MSCFVAFSLRPLSTGDVEEEPVGSFLGLLLGFEASEFALCAVPEEALAELAIALVELLVELLGRLFS